MNVDILSLTLRLDIGFKMFMKVQTELIEREEGREGGRKGGEGGREKER